MVARPERDRGVHAHQRQPAGGEPHGLHLSLVHRVHVGNAQVAGGEQLCLVGGATLRGGADRGRAGGVHHALHLGAHALLEHDLRARHVHREEALGVRGAHGRDSRAVEYPVDSLEGPSHRPAVADLEPDPGEVEAVERRVRGPLLHAEADLVAPLHRQAGHVRPHEPGGPGDECARRGQVTARWRWSPSKRRWQSRQRTASGTALSRSGGIGRLQIQHVP